MVLVNPALVGRLFQNHSTQKKLWTWLSERGAAVIPFFGPELVTESCSKEDFVDAVDAV